MFINVWKFVTKSPSFDVIFFVLIFTFALVAPSATGQGFSTLCLCVSHRFSYFFCHFFSGLLSPPLCFNARKKSFILLLVFSFSCFSVLSFAFRFASHWSFGQQIVNNGTFCCLWVGSSWFFSSSSFVCSFVRCFIDLLGSTKKFTFW